MNQLGGDERFQALLAAARNEKLRQPKISQWTRLEEALLMGVVYSKFLYRGGLFAPSSAVAKIRQHASPEQMFWADIHGVFNLIKKKISPKSYPRATNALRRRYKEIKLRSKRTGGQMISELVDIWNNQINKDNTLIDPDLFHDCVEIESILGKRRRESQHKQQTAMRSTSWTVEEEIVLVGLVVQQFVSKGSLVLSRQQTEEKLKSFEPQRLWKSIKQSNDKVWQKLGKINVVRPVCRTEQALKRRYKTIKGQLESSRRIGTDLNRLTINQLNQSFQLINQSEILTQDVKPTKKDMEKIRVLLEKSLDELGMSVNYGK